MSDKTVCVDREALHTYTQLVSLAMDFYKVGTDEMVELAGEVVRLASAALHGVVCRDIQTPSLAQQQDDMAQFEGILATGKAAIDQVASLGTKFEEVQ